jgi:hypothetical protein
VAYESIQVEQIGGKDLEKGDWDLLQEPQGFPLSTD